MCKVVVKGVDKGWGGVGEPAFFFLEPPPPPCSSLCREGGARNYN